jgi:hypothetical protein
MKNNKSAVLGMVSGYFLNNYNVTKQKFLSIILNDQEAMNKAIVIGWLIQTNQSVIEEEGEWSKLNRGYNPWGETCEVIENRLEQEIESFLEYYFSSAEETLKAAEITLKAAEETLAAFNPFVKKADANGIKLTGALVHHVFFWLKEPNNETHKKQLVKALNDLTIISTGLYGKELLAQNGAPLRLVVPWK